MRIGVNATSYGKRYTGIGTYTEFLIEALCKNDHEVFVYSSEKSVGCIGSATFRQVPLGLGFDGGRMANVKRFLWLQSSFSSHLRRDGVQLMISPSAEGLLWPRVPQVVTVHDLMPLRFIDENPRQYYYYRYVLPRVLAATTLVLTVSEFSRQEIVQTYNIESTRVSVAGTGLVVRRSSPDREYKERSGSRPYFLFVGTFSPRKNLETILKAFAAIARDVEEDLVVVAYPDQWKARTLETVSRLNIEDRVTYSWDMSRTQLTELYCHATALTLVSEYEGFGLPPLEAMTVGTPVIVSDSTSLSEVVGDAGLKVPSHDANALAAAMQMLSHDSGLRARLGERGRYRALKYDRQNCIEILHRAIAPLIKGSPALQPTTAS